MRYNRRKFTKALIYRGGPTTFEFEYDFTANGATGNKLGVDYGTDLWKDSLHFYKQAGQGIGNTDNNVNGCVETLDLLGFDPDEELTVEMEIRFENREQTVDGSFEIYLSAPNTSQTPPFNSSTHQCRVKFVVEPGASPTPAIKRFLYTHTAGGILNDVTLNNALTWNEDETKTVKVVLSPPSSSRTLKVYVDDVLLSTDTFAWAQTDADYRRIIFDCRSFTNTRPHHVLQTIRVTGELL